MTGIAASVVLVAGPESERTKFGTGFVVGQGDDLYVVTCAHVVRDLGGPEHVTVRGEPVSLVAMEPWPDVAVLRAEGAAGLPPLPLAVGTGGADDEVRTAGFQLYGGEYRLDPFKARFARQVDLQDPRGGDRVRAFALTVADGRLQQGCSGSPVVDGTGAVVAIVTHKEGDGERGMAVSTDALRLVWPAVERYAVAAPAPEAKRRDGLTLEAVREQTALFVGRQEELRALRGAVDALRQGRGTVGFVVGEAGTGKSMLLLKVVEEVLTTLPDCVLAYARADVVAGAHTSYGPFKSALEQVLASGRALDAAARTLRDMGIRRLGTFASFTGVATGALQERLGAGDAETSFDQDTLMDCYAKVLREVAAEVPVVMVLDDVHWADDSSLLLFQHLARAVDQRVLLLATYRPEEADHRPLLREVADRLAAAGALCVDLQQKSLQERDPQGRAFCLDYLTTRYGTHFPDRFVDLVAALTGGNALFLAETLTNLEETGHLARAGDAWTLTRPVDELPELPTRVERVIAERVARLDENLLSILKYGSVEGETFTAEVVASLQKVHDRELLRTVAEKLIRMHRLVVSAATMRLLSGTSLHTFGFRHVLTQRYVYDHLLTEFERQYMHEEVARTLETVCGTDVPELVPRIATHYAHAGVPDKTVEYALRAGEMAVAEYAWSEATRFGRLALRALETAPDVARGLPAEKLVRVRLLYAKGELEGGVSDEPVDHAQLAYDAMQPTLPLLGSVPAALAVDAYLTLGRIKAVRAILTDFLDNSYVRTAIDIAEKAGDKRALAEALSGYHVTTNVADQSTAGEVLAARRRRVELAEELGDQILLAESLSLLATHYVNFDTDEEDPLALAEEHATRALGIAERQNVVAELYARQALSWILHHRGYYGERLESFRTDALEIARSRGQTAFEADALTDLGHYYAFLVGEEETAIRIKQEAYDLRVRLGRHPVIDAEHLAELAYRQGRYADSRDLLGRYLDRQDAVRAARARCLIARAFAKEGDEVAALAELAPAEQAAPSAPLDAAAAMAYLALGRADDARRHAERLIPAVPASGKRGLFWTYYDYPTLLAEVYLAGGDRDAARRWIETADGWWQRLSSVTDLDRLVMYADHGRVRAAIGDA